MKKTMGLAAALLVVMIVLTGCSGGNGLEGKTWKYTYDAGSYYTLSFSGGTCTETYVDLITGEHQTNTYSYSISGNKITMNGGTASWSVSGNTLTITENGQTLSLERQ